MKKALLIINPRSGRLKTKSSLFNIVEAIDKNGFIASVRITTKEGDAKSFAYEGAISGEYDVIVCSGGDGTLSETITGVIESDKMTPIGYIPSGSTNDYAKSLGIPFDMAEAAKLATSGKEHFIDIGSINGRYFDYVASFGAFTSVSYTAPQSLKNMMGHMAYVLAGIKDLAAIKPIWASVQNGDKTYEGEYIFGAITNSTSIGGIVKIDDALVEFNDGLFEVCLVKTPKNPADLSRIMMGAINSDFTNDSFEFFKTDNVTIRMEKGIDWSLDGEKYSGDKDVLITVKKSAIKMIL